MAQSVRCLPKKQEDPTATPTTYAQARPRGTEVETSGPLGALWLPDNQFQVKETPLSKDNVIGWRSGSRVKHTGWSCRGLGFSSQHLCVTPVLGYPMTSSELCGHQAYRWCINIDVHAGKTFIHIKKKKGGLPPSLTI